MDYQLAGRRACVFAGAHGIGAAIANLLAAEGVQVIVADRDGDALAAADTGWAGRVVADLATAAGVASAVQYALDTFGQAPDILINNLGVGNAGTFDAIDDEAWSASFQVNLMGAVRASRALIPLMAARGGGAVVNTGSDLAKQPEPAFMDYGAFKAGLLYLTKALAKQYAPTVRVNAVLPGPIWSQMWTRPGGLVDQITAQYGLSREASVERFLHDRQMPMGIGHADDVAHAAVFLASPRARLITGAALDIGGTIRGLI
jgi:NAD(P)-dependent dehydrogenase (short-subunit alcohol dehydrogenase family)